MSRLFPAFFSAVLFLTISVANAQQTAPAKAPAASAPASPVTAKQTPIPVAYESASPQSVPSVLQQNALDRVQGLLVQHYRWSAWPDMPPAIHAFLAERDPQTAKNIKPNDIMTYFAVEDIDTDGASDLILRLGSRDSCAVGTYGCAYAIYYADKKKGRAIVNARKVVPVKHGLLIHNRFYAIMPHNGDTYTALSYKAFTIDDPFNPIVVSLNEAMLSIFPSFYDAMERPPGFRYTLFDLNNDGKKEIILTIMEDDQEWEMFCDKEDEYSCPVLIYSTKENNTADKLLGFFRSRQDLVIGRANAKGYADIITTGMNVRSLRNYVYSMNPKTGQYGRSN